MNDIILAYLGIAGIILATIMVFIVIFLPMLFPPEEEEE